MHKDMFFSFARNNKAFFLENFNEDLIRLGGQPWHCANRRLISKGIGTFILSNDA